MSITAEQRDAWVAALRSGTYRQGTGSLRHIRLPDGEEQFCCLGVFAHAVLGLCAERLLGTSLLYHLDRHEELPDDVQDRLAQAERLRCDVRADRRPAGERWRPGVVGMTDTRDAPDLRPRRGVKEVRRIMCNITVGRYPPPPECGIVEPDGTIVRAWQGWIEPDDKSWIIFVAADGTPRVYLNRDPHTGAVRDTA